MKVVGSRKDLSVRVVFDGAASYNGDMKGHRLSGGDSPVPSQPEFRVRKGLQAAQRNAHLLSRYFDSQPFVAQRLRSDRRGRQLPEGIRLWLFSRLRSIFIEWWRWKIPRVSLKLGQRTVVLSGRIRCPRLRKDLRGDFSASPTAFTAAGFEGWLLTGIGGEDGLTCTQMQECCHAQAGHSVL